MRDDAAKLKETLDHVEDQVGAGCAADIRAFIAAARADGYARAREQAEQSVFGTIHESRERIAAMEDEMP